MVNGIGDGVVGLFFLVLVAFSSVLGFLGCEGKTNVADVEVVYRVDEGVLGELEGVWVEAGEKLVVLSGEVSDVASGLRYSEVGECLLVYDFEVTTKASRSFEEAAGVRDRVRVEQVLGRFELEARVGAEWRLKGRGIGNYVVRNDVRLPGKEWKAGEMGDVRVENKGAALRVEDASSVLWGGVHAFGGLGVFFPDFPVNATMVGGDVERVGKDNVWVVDHLLVNGVAAAVVVVAGDGFLGRYVVLNSGRVLHAAVSWAGKRVDGVVRSQVAEARLTGACDGPALPPIGKKTSRVRRALDVYTGFVFAVNGDQGDRLGAYLSQDLVDAHGLDAIMDMLKGHVGRFGIGVLGDPSLVEPAEIDGKLLRFRVIGRADDRETGEVGTVVNHVVMEDGPEGMRVLSIGTTKNQVGREADMLEVSGRRIFAGGEVVEK